MVLHSLLFRLVLRSKPQPSSGPFYDITIYISLRPALAYHGLLQDPLSPEFRTAQPRYKISSPQPSSFLLCSTVR